MPDADLSVVIPCYNGARFIRGALESVFQQTLQPREVIVVDDVSTDSSAEIVGSVAACAPLPVRLIRMQRNSGGPPAPINRGIDAAQGAWIALLEQDDRMVPDRLQCEMDCQRRDPSLGLVFSRCLCVKNGSSEESPDPRVWMDRFAMESLGGAGYRIRGEVAYEALVDKMFALTCSTFLFPKRIWTQGIRFDEAATSNCDYTFLQRVTRQYDIGFVDRPLVHWFLRTDSLYRTSGQAKRYDDLLYALNGFDRSRLGRYARKRLRRRIREEALGAAYCNRQTGRYRHALRYYLLSIIKGRPCGEAVRGIASLPPRYITHRLRGAN